MYKITPTTELVFELINNNKPYPVSKLLILLSVLKNIFLAHLIAIIVVSAVLYHLIDTQESKVALLIVSGSLFSIMIIGSIFYTIKKYSLSIKLYKYSVENFDLSINEIGDDSDTTMSGYMIDYLCIESSIFDAQTIDIKNQRPINYGVVRSQILERWNKNKSPNVPFQSEGYSNYMHILRHLFTNNPVSQNTFRELYKQTIL